MNVQQDVPSIPPAGTPAPHPAALEAVALIEQALAQVLRNREDAPAPRTPDAAGVIEYDSWLARLH